MAYSTQADLLKMAESAVLVDLTDDSGTGAIGAEVVTRAIADADEEIDGYVGGRYPVPLSPVPGIIRKFSVDLALFNLYSRRRHLTMPDQVMKRYDVAIKFLTSVAKGDVSLGASDPGGNPPGAEAPVMASDNPTKIFGRDKMRGF